MLDNEDTNETNPTDQVSSTTSDPAPVSEASAPDDAAPVKKAGAKKTAARKTGASAKKAAAKKTTAKKATKSAEAAESADPSADDAPQTPKKRAASRKRAAAAVPETTAESDAPQDGSDGAAAPMVLFKAPEKKTAPPRKKAAKKAATGEDDASQGSDDKPAQNSQKGGKAKKRAETPDTREDASDEETDDQDDSEDSGDGEGGARRRRRRGGRRRRRPSDGSGEDTDDSDDSEDASGDADTEGSDGAEGGTTASRRRRRRRRSGDDSGGSGDDSDSGGPRARKQRNPEDEITSIGGSTRLEAKKQRRREGREAGRRRAPIVSEAEFLARRESVDRVMVIRQKDDLTQIGVLEDKVLVEHYVARESQTSLIGNVYLGRVQNVLPSMEAAFIDIGKGRNAVLYAGEVNWSAVGHKEGQPRKIESVLSSGETVLVQVSKDPVGHKGARLTGQISLPGRFLVYVPEGNTSGISRKLPDTERNRLKTLLKEIVPESAGVIVRTAAEGASEDELTRDVERLTARWNDIEEKVKAGKSPQLLYGEPDLTLKVVRDLFTEDFAKLVVQGDDAWDLVENYVSHVAPDLQERLERFEPGDSGKDLFATYRVDEQIAKGLDRKVWLPSGGSLIIDRTEAMTVVDVNTGKFTGSGGNLEETVTKNNLEAAEEMVRQLRLRDIGGIIVVDFIDMVLESNRDLVLRRLVECLGRDRTRHQVAEVTSLGLVQMTRKRIGTGLLEAFSRDCEHCKGRGVIVHDHPVENDGRPDDDEPRGRRTRGGRNRGRGGAPGGGNGNGGNGSNGGGAHGTPSPADLARSKPPEKVDVDLSEDQSDETADDQGPDKSVIGTPSTTPPEPQTVPSSTNETPDAPESTDSTVTAEATAATQTPAEPPRVVTSTRRRSARRPAGPPVAADNGAAELGAAELGAGRQSPPSAEPVDVPVEPAVSGHAPEATPEERGGTDPTATDDPVATPDPLAGGADDGASLADPTWPDAAPGTNQESDQDAEQDRGDEDDTNGFSLLHVPIKRKGSRKR